MGMSRAEMDKVVDDHFRFEATDDIEGVMASFVPDGPITHECVPSTVGILHDRGQMADFYKDLFACAKGEKATMISRFYGDDFLIDETLWEGEQYDGRPFLLPGKGGHAAFRLLHVFTFRDGKIASEQVWTDLAAIQRQLR
jgi:hypothetical protein